MKIRNGFVSNSSSSSFVVAFSKKPETEKEVQEIMFKNEFYHYVDNFYMGEYIVSGVSTSSLAKKVFYLIKDKDCAHENEVVESVLSGWFEPYKGLPGLYDYDDSEEYKSLSSKQKEDISIMRKIWDKANDENYRRAEAIASLFMKENKDAFVFTLRFSDNDGEQIEEHGNIFENVPHIKINCH